MTATLQLESITAGYGPTTVLWDVDLEVPANSVVALLGPNGAGKTTLLRVACGFIPTKQGRIALNGVDLTGKPPHEISRLGVCHIPESRGIFPSLSVRENLTLFGPKQTETEQIQRATAAFPILGVRLRQTAGSLSGGEQQMLAIVRAYISNPALVLVDEASMGLGPSSWTSSSSFCGALPTREHRYSSSSSTFTGPSPSPTRPTCSTTAAWPSRARPTSYKNSTSSSATWAPKRRSILILGCHDGQSARMT